MTDDELIEKMVAEFHKKPVDSSINSFDRMRAALAVVRPIIEREALEKAAKVAEWGACGGLDVDHIVCADTCESIAAAIRALGGDNEQDS